MMEKISSAAAHCLLEGRECILFGGRKHSDVHTDGLEVQTYGYWTTHKRFINRQQAAAIAVHAGQAIVIRNPTFGLSSLDLVKDYPCLV